MSPLLICCPRQLKPFHGTTQKYLATHPHSPLAIRSPEYSRDGTRRRRGRGRTPALGSGTVVHRGSRGRIRRWSAAGLFAGCDWPIVGGTWNVGTATCCESGGPTCPYPPPLAFFLPCRLLIGLLIGLFLCDCLLVCLSFCLFFFLSARVTARGKNADLYAYWQYKVL